MLCLITRIKVRRVSTVAWILISYLRMRRRARTVPGLLDMAVQLRSPRAVVFVSLWEDANAMAEFNTAVPEHPLEVRRMRVAGAEVWSGLFRFVGPSPTARAWPELALTSRKDPG